MPCYVEIAIVFFLFFFFFCFHLFFSLGPSTPSCRSVSFIDDDDDDDDERACSVEWMGFLVLNTRRFRACAISLISDLKQDLSKCSYSPCTPLAQWLRLLLHLHIQPGGVSASFSHIYKISLCPSSIWYSPSWGIKGLTSYGDLLVHHRYPEPWTHQHEKSPKTSLACKLSTNSHPLWLFHLLFLRPNRSIYISLHHSSLE